jgi:L-threonylcarbamoyladenylate synthase
MGGGVAIFPTDTVYGVCCDPEDEAAAMRLYRLKGYEPVRQSARPAAVMFFSLQRALEELPDLHEAERAALETLLPGPVTLLLPNRVERFGAACGPDPATLGLRVPHLPDALARLRAVEVGVMQSSANLVGQPDARTLATVPAGMRADVDLVLDGGELAGMPSTVIDLRKYEASGEWHVLREGALATEAVRELLDQAR